MKAAMAAAFAFESLKLAQAGDMSCQFSHGFAVRKKGLAGMLDMTNLSATYRPFGSRSCSFNFAGQVYQKEHTIYGECAHWDSSLHGNSLFAGF
jgi:hypothetical protein